jgi:hypothetical protein
MAAVVTPHQRGHLNRLVAFHGRDHAGGFPPGVFSKMEVVEPPYMAP